jgi:hypothetical protein
MRKSSEEETTPIELTNKRVKMHEPSFRTKIKSGGAAGADFFWSKVSLENGLEPLAISFEGHFIDVPSGTKQVILSSSTLNEADAALTQVAKILKRNLPPVNGYVRKLLQRNYHIVKDVDAIYAIGYIKHPSKGLGIDGGTAWGCEISKLDETKGGSKCHLYFFDMETSHWLTWNGEWRRIDPPSPLSFDRCALIGSRELTRRGLDAIHSVWKNDVLKPM